MNTRMVPMPSDTIIPERDLHRQPVLDVRNLGIDFGGLTAVDKFTLTIGATEIAGLIGPNGAGKTTIFNLLTNVYQPTFVSWASLALWHNIPNSCSQKRSWAI